MTKKSRFEEFKSKDSRGPAIVRHGSRHATQTTIQGEVEKKRQGYAFLLHQPEDIFIPAAFAQKLMTGDVVRAVVNPKTGDVFSVENVKRSLKQFIGTYDAPKVILEERNLREEILIKQPAQCLATQVHGLKNGDKVLVEITKYEPRLEGTILRSFGAILAPKLDTFSVVVRAGWPQEFSAEAGAQAELSSREIQKEAAQKKYPGRKDLRQKQIVTIDGADSRDFDDAILVEKTGSGYVLTVAVADVAEFVKQGSTLDSEAYARATSVYFPEWVIPMLPEALSNGACSLRPGEDKLVLVCEMHYTFDGKKRSAKIFEAVIKSHRRCIYEDVQKEYESGDSFWKHPYELFDKIRTQRLRRGALDLELPEAKVMLDENGDTIGIKKLDRVDAHKVIEEFMIAANESVTEIMEREAWPFVYRVHEPPKQESLAKFERFAMALGLRPKIQDPQNPKSYTRFLELIKDKPFATTLSYLLLRSLKQARYEPVNHYHFGLASKAYTHFTSPIRRYPDLIVHRILKKFIRERRLSGNHASELTGYLNEACEHCSKQERKAESLDRQVIKIKKARFMEKHLGRTFKARISNVSEAGLFVELEEWFVDGLVPIDTLGGDYFEYIESKLMLKGKRSGRKFTIGDNLMVDLVKVEIESGFIEFVPA